MLRAIQEFFRSHINSQQGGEHDEHSLQLATAALLFEMQRVDHDEHPEERAALETALKKTFSLSEAETRELAELAEREARESVSLHQFTSLINNSFQLNEKIHIVEMLWRVAYADARLDRYEEALVRKIADLLYVPHRDFIQAKHRVQEELK